MRLRAFTLVEIMIVLLIIGILVLIALPGVLRSRMNANDAYAKQVLRSMSSACEWYLANSNSTGYPVSEIVLLAAAPPYLNSGYCGTTVSGYAYTCVLDPNGYTVTATPTTVGSSGTTTYTVATGGVITP